MGTKVNRSYRCQICRKFIPKGEEHSHHILPPSVINHSRSGSTSYSSLKCCSCGDFIDQDCNKLTPEQFSQVELARARERYLDGGYEKQKLGGRDDDGGIAAEQCNGSFLGCRRLPTLHSPSVDKNIELEQTTTWETRRLREGWKA